MSARHRAAQKPAPEPEWSARDILGRPILLAIAARYIGLTDEDLAILGPVALIIAGVVIRAGVFTPASIQRLLDGEDEQGS